MMISHKCNINNFGNTVLCRMFATYILVNPNPLKFGNYGNKLDSNSTCFGLCHWVDSFPDTEKQKR